MSLTEKLHPSGFIVSECDGNISRDNGILISGQNLVAGTVLGKITLAGASETHAGNTGTGAMTLDATTPVLANAQAGVYSVKCIAVATDSGTFEVKDPQGRSLGEYVVGATFADQIKFVIADATDFILGDTFLVTVAAGSGKFTILAPAALDGSQAADGILVAAVDASAGDVACLVLARNAEVNTNELTWPGGITTPQKAAATAQLQALGIVIRS